MGDGSSRPYIKLQKDRVVRDIIARGLLSKQEMRICAFVWHESWGWNRSTSSPEFPITVALICEFTGMAERPARRTWMKLLEDQVILSHSDGSHEFNEHFEMWGGGGPNRSERTQQVRTEKVRKTDSIGPKGGPNRSENRTEQVRSLPYTEQEEHTEQEKQGRQLKNPQLGPVIETLQSIDSKVYRSLEPTIAFEEILVAEGQRLGGVEVILGHAQRFAVWLEDQFQSGAEKREKRGRPQKRFADWLKREEPSPDPAADSNYAELERQYIAGLKER